MRILIFFPHDSDHTLEQVTLLPCRYLDLDSALSFDSCFEQGLYEVTCDFQHKNYSVVLLFAVFGVSREHISTLKLFQDSALQILFPFF